MAPESGIVYSSNIVIADESELSTLSLLYDTVFLPHASGVPSSLGYEKDVGALLAWDDKWKPLFTERVLRRLPSVNVEVRPDIEVRFAYEEASAVLSILRQEAHPDDSTDSFFELPHLEKLRIAFAGDMAQHLSRNDIDLPHCFAPTRLDDYFSPFIRKQPNFAADRRNARQLLTELEAFAVFRYFLPKLNALQPDEILELRKKVKDTREGFMMHLQKLSGNMDSLARGGATIVELRASAEDIVETELIPDYMEFRRQLSAERAGKWKKPLDAAGKIAGVIVAIRLLRFRGQSMIEQQMLVDTT